LSLGIDGGGRRDRTDDPLLAKQVLSQLSYAPSITNVRLRTSRRLLHRLTPFGSEMLVSAKALTIIAMVGLVGFEPTTPALSRRCSNRLSYRPLSLSIFTVDKREHLTL
jgi:hypothetical protein